jgi:hypothetical protein
MRQDDLETREVSRKLSRSQAKLARHERLTGIVLGCLTFLAVMALGVVIGHLADLPLLSHGR